MTEATEAERNLTEATAELHAAMSEDICWTFTVMGPDKKVVEPPPVMNYYNARAKLLQLLGFMFSGQPAGQRVAFDLAANPVDAPWESDVRAQQFEYGKRLKLQKVWRTWHVSLYPVDDSLI